MILMILLNKDLKENNKFSLSLMINFLYLLIHLAKYTEILSNQNLS